MSFSGKCILELEETRAEALRLTKTGNPSDLAQANLLRGHIDTLKKTKISSDEARSLYVNALVDSLKPESVSEEQRTRAFHAYVLKGDRISESEKRDLLVGTETISYTAGNQGGYLVPVTTELEVLFAMNNYDPLLSESVCDFKISDTPKFTPTVLNGFDLSAVTAALVGETVQQVNTQFPNVLAKTLRSNLIYKSSLSASIEALEDIPSAVSKFAEVFGVALGRTISQDCITGNGTSQPQGILTALPTRAYTTANAGKIVLNDITGIYFSIDRFWRNRPKTGWLMSDSVYQRIRQATDNNGRPLINVNDNGTEVLMNRPIYITPSLPAVGGSIGLNSVIIFGDLASFHIRMSKITMQKSINSSIVDITTGRALFIARTRVDSIYTDFSLGNSPALVAATVIA